MSKIYGAGRADVSNALWGSSTRKDGDRPRLRARVGVLVTALALTLSVGAPTAVAKPRWSGYTPTLAQATVVADDALVADATASVSYSDVSYSDVSYADLSISALVSYDD